MYLSTHTKLGFNVIASVLCSHVWWPREVHVTIAKEVLWYLSVTWERAFVLKPGSHRQLCANIDGGWGNQSELNRLSRSRRLIMHGNLVVHPSSNLQKFVTLSSTEVQYIALSVADLTNTWLGRKLQSLVLNSSLQMIFGTRMGLWITREALS